MSQEIQTLQKIAEEIIELKEHIYDLNQNLKELEMQAIAIVGHNTEGSRTVPLDGMSVQTVGKVTRTINPNKLKEIWNEIPDNVRKACIKFKPTLDLKNYRDLRQYDEQLWYKLADAIIAKPAKTAVNIKMMKEEE